MKENTMPKPESENYPQFMHDLPDHPEPPVKLEPCPFCGGDATPCYQSGIYYGTPGFFVRCTRCAAKGTPHIYGVRIIFPLENVHMITEAEALEKACNSWNQRTQQTTIYYQPNNSGNIINTRDISGNNNATETVKAYKK